MVNKVFRLIEATLETITQEFSKVPDDVRQHIIDIDFTKGDREVGKLAKPLLQLYVKSGDSPDLSKLPEALKLYKKFYYKKQLDKFKYPSINQYASIEEFVGDVLTGVDPNPIIFDDGTWKIRELNSRNACIQYASYADYGWCTGQPDGSYYNSSYNKSEGDIYLIYKNNKVHSQLFVTKAKDRTEWNYPHNEPVDEDDFKDSSFLKWMYDNKILKQFKGIVFRGRKIKYTMDGNAYVFASLDLSDLELKSLMEFKDGALGGADYTVSGNFSCNNNQLTTLEGAPQSVESFDCNFNRLTTLEGAPQSVGWNFFCSYNQLTTLEGAPQSVGRNFYCSSNQLTTLEGAPQSVGWNFYCSSNQLTTLKGAPKSVEGHFSCNGNQLTTLEGAPQSVGGDFYCDSNQLTTLEGAPQSVGESFSCNNNQLTTLKGAPRCRGFSCDSNQLTTLEGAPQSVGGNFSCDNNQLTTLEGAPHSVGGNFSCDNNQLTTLEGLGKVKGIVKVRPGNDALSDDYIKEFLRTHNLKESKMNRKTRKVEEAVAEQPENVSDTTTGYEVPMVYRVCYSCGYSEKVNIKEEDTPAKTKYCPDCGHILNRLSGTEMFHLNFVNDKEVLPANMEVLPELPFRDIGPGNPITVPSEIAFVKAEGKVFTYQGRSLKSRVERRAKNGKFESIRNLLSKSQLIAVDGVPFKRYGVFGLSEGEFLNKVMEFKPVTMQEIKEHKVAFVNENNYRLRLRIDEEIVEFQPREGFPFFTKQVASTVFEDFIRQAKNLMHEPHRLLAFAMSNGTPVHTESTQKESKYPVRVKPSNFRTFKLFASVLDKKKIFWRGDHNYMKVKGDKAMIESIVHKIDPYAVVSEETVSGDINPGYVVRDKKRAKKVQKWLTKTLKGKVAEVKTDAKGMIQFRLMQEESQEFTNRLNVVKSMLGDLSGKFHWDNGYVYESGLTLNQVFLGEENDGEEETSFNFEAFFPEDIDEDKLELLQNEYAYFKEMLPEWTELFDVEEYEIPDKVNEFLGVIQSIISETEEETGEPVTQEMFTSILEDYRDSDEDIAQFVQYVTGREIPDYASLYILSDALAIPFLPVENWYNEFVGMESSSEGGDAEVEAEIEEPEEEFETEEE